MTSNTLPQQTVTERKACSLPELAGLYQVSLGFLRNEVRRDALKVTRFGRRVLVLREDWDAYLRSRPTNGAAAR
jgi:hypothetical protein